MQLDDTPSEQAGRDHPKRRYDVAELFLPEHLRLGADNWPEFELAIETVLRLKGIPLAHLRCAGCRSGSACPRMPSAFDEADGDGWAADDELCKTLLVLNVRSDHVRLAWRAHGGWSAAQMWALLVRRHEESERERERKVAWLQCVGFLAPWVFLAVVCTASLLGA